MNKKILIVALIIVAILIGGWLIWNSRSFQTKCAEEGESTGTCVGCFHKCCDGLKEMADLKIGGECVEIPPPGSGSVCSNCGNGVCDEQNNENKCNCPEDCSMFYCDSKKDCIVVNFDCSSCKCDLRAINKNYKNEICKNFTGKYCDRACKAQDYKCKNNKCEILNDQSDTSDLSSKALATKDWQTYRNEEYGFEFKYPKGLEIKEYSLSNDNDSFNINRKSIVFAIDNEFKYVMNFNLWKNPDKLELTDWLKETGIDMIIDINISKEPNMYIDKVPALRIFSEGGHEMSHFYYFVYQDKGYSMSLKYKKGLEISEEVEKSFNQILSTFKFIE